VTIATGSDASIQVTPEKPSRAVISPSAAALSIVALIESAAVTTSEETSSAACSIAASASAQASSGEHSTTKVTSKTTGTEPSHPWSLRIFLVVFSSPSLATTTLTPLGTTSPKTLSRKATN